VLDAAAIAMVHRAEPFPPPPAEAGDDRLKFIQPVIFAKKPSFAGSPRTRYWQKTPKAKMRYAPSYAASAVAASLSNEASSRSDALRLRQEFNTRADRTLCCKSFSITARKKSGAPLQDAPD